MPKIDLCFRGWVRGAEVTELVNADGEKIDCSDWSAEKVARTLEKGELTVSLGDHLYTNEDAEIEMFDFEESTD